MDPLTAAFIGGIAILVLMVGVISLLLWPDQKPVVRTYHEPQRVTAQRQRLRAIAGAEWKRKP